MTRAGVRASITDLRESAVTLGWDLPLFGAAMFVDQGGRLVLSLVAAGLLGPRDFGLWVVIALVIQYTSIGSLGVPQGAGREIPKQLGANDAAGANRTEDVAAFGSLVGGGVVALIAALALPFVFGGTEGTTSVTLVLLICATFLQQLFILEQALFRSRLRFRQAALQLATQGVAAPLVGIVLLASGQGVDGLLGARVVVLTVALAFAARTLARIPRPTWDPGAIGELIRIGFPMVLAGTLFLLLVTADRWIVLTYLGRAAVGRYGLVGLAASSLLLIPTLISQQFYPRLAFALGGGANGRALLGMARSQGLLAGALSGATAAIGAACAWAFIPVLLPQYSGVVLPIAIVLLGGTTYAAASPFGNLLNLLDRQRLYVAIQAVALAVDIGLGFLLVVAGFGIDGIAVASALTMAAYAVALRAAASGVADHVAGDRLGISPSSSDVSASP